jgi:hypothetical protein
MDHPHGAVDVTNPSSSTTSFVPTRTIRDSSGAERRGPGSRHATMACRPVARILENGFDDMTYVEIAMQGVWTRGGEGRPQALHATPARRATPYTYSAATSHQ